MESVFSTSFEVYFVILFFYIYIDDKEETNLIARTFDFS